MKCQHFDVKVLSEEHSAVESSVGSKPKLGSARLGFGSSFWEKKLGSARLAMPSKKLGSARLAISCKKSSVQLSLLFHLKNQDTLKSKKLADF